MNAVNPFFHRSPIHIPNYFFGRQETLTQIISLLCNRQSVAVLGPHRIGKTSLLLHLLRMNHAHIEADPNIWVYLDCQAWHHASPQALYAYMATALLKVLCERSQASWEVQVGDELSLYVLQQLVGDIAAAGYHTLFLLDEFDTLRTSSGKNAEMLCGLKSLAMSGCVGTVIAATQALPTGAEAGFGTSGLPFLNTCATVHLGLFSHAEAMNLLGVLSARSGRVFSMETMQWLIQLAGPHPLYVQLAGSCAFEYLIRHGTLDSSESRAQVRKTFLDQVTPYWCHVWSALGEKDRQMVALLLFHPDYAPSAIQCLEQACLVMRQSQAVPPIQWLSREFKAFVSHQSVAELKRLLPVRV